MQIWMLLIVTLPVESDQSDCQQSQDEEDSIVHCGVTIANQNFGYD